jgi:hypothetical protein
VTVRELARLLDLKPLETAKITQDPALPETRGTPKNYQIHHLNTDSDALPRSKMVFADGGHHTAPAALLFAATPGSAGR